MSPLYIQRKVDRIRKLCFSLLLTMCALFEGCMTVQFGTTPRVDRLEFLKPAISSKADVLMTLGEPRGRGMTRFVSEMLPREIWFYKYVETQGKNRMMRFLLVFFDKGGYDGYLWFFSGYEFEKAQLPTDVQVRVVKRPDISILESGLRIGESSRMEILNLLGRPSGEGAEMLPWVKKQRTMWTYYYEEGSFKDDRRLFLFIFLDGDRYDGYMWFSSLLQKRITPFRQ